VCDTGNGIILSRERGGDFLDLLGSKGEQHSCRAGTFFCATRHRRELTNQQQTVSTGSANQSARESRRRRYKISRLQSKTHMCCVERAAAIVHHDRRRPVTILRQA
jgi:hypothetical protein